MNAFATRGIGTPWFNCAIDKASTAKAGPSIGGKTGRTFLGRNELVVYIAHPVAPDRETSESQFRTHLLPHFKPKTRITLVAGFFSPPRRLFQRVAPVDLREERCYAPLGWREVRTIFTGET